MEPALGWDQAVQKRWYKREQIYFSGSGVCSFDEQEGMRVRDRVTVYSEKKRLRAKRNTSRLFLMASSLSQKGGS